MASGEVSAARTITSATPRFRVFVASLAPLRTQSEPVRAQIYTRGFAVRVMLGPGMEDSLLELPVVGALLDEVQNLLREGGVGDGPGGGSVLGGHFSCC